MATTKNLVKCIVLSNCDCISLETAIHLICYIGSFLVIPPSNFTTDFKSSETCRNSYVKAIKMFH